MILALLVMAVDPQQLARQCGEASAMNHTAWQQYAYRRHVILEYTNAEGKRTGGWTETWDVINLEGSRYQRKVGVNDQPLSGKLQKEEEARLKKEAEVRQAESPEQRKRRIAGYTGFHTFDLPYGRLSEIYTLTYQRHEVAEGVETEVIAAEPKAAFIPSNDDEREWAAYRITLWIDPRSGIAVKELIEVVADLPRVLRGSTMVAVRQALPDGVWAPREVRFSIAKRVSSKVTSHLTQTETYADLHKFQAESRVMDQGGI